MSINIGKYYQSHCTDTTGWEQNFTLIDLNNDTIVFCKAALQVIS